jgi:hypothetical protein
MRQTKFAWIALLALVLISFALIFIPAWFIQPFKAQTPGKVELSYLFKYISPFVTPLALLLTLGLAAYLWRINPRWWRKVGLVAAGFLVSFMVWFSRQNHFEWMFNPVSNPQYVKAEDAKFVNQTDMVLAVQINGEAAAYPVRQLAYHHLVHDTVGGRPIVATY